MNYEDAARALGVSRRTVERLVERREIAFVRIAGRVLFTERHIGEYLARNTQAAILPKTKPTTAGD